MYPTSLKARYRREQLEKEHNDKYSGKLKGGAFPHGQGIDDIVSAVNGLPWSDDHMRKICEGKVNILSYRHVMQAGSLADVLGQHGAAIILYETKPQYGHWVALFSVAPGVVEFFDSYGCAPDSQLRFVPPAMKCRPVLAKLFKQACVQCIWNKIPLQASSEDMSTCGRWASMRIGMRKTPKDSFVRLFVGQKLKPDSYATLMTCIVH